MKHDNFNYILKTRLLLYFQIQLTIKQLEKKTRFQNFHDERKNRRLENIYTLIKFTQVKLEICPGLRTKHSKHWLISRF